MPTSLTPDELAARLLVGAGGQGKTRLARRLCEQSSADGWVTGFVGGQADRAAAARLADSRMPALAVIDYAETRFEQVRELINAATEPTERVRLLLLARSDGEWWQQLRPKLRYHVHLDAPATLSALERHHRRPPRRLPGRGGRFGRRPRATGGLLRH